MPMSITPKAMWVMLAPTRSKLGRCLGAGLASGAWAACPSPAGAGRRRLSGGSTWKRLLKTSRLATAKEKTARPL